SSTTTKTLPSGVAACSWASASRPRSRRTWSAPSASARALATILTASSSGTLEAIGAPSRGAMTTLSIWVDNSRSSAIAAAASTALTLAQGTCRYILIVMTNETAVNWLLPYRRMAGETGVVLAKYLRDRGPHLAAMVAYYALLSLFPFLFLILSALGL